MKSSLIKKPHWRSSMSVLLCTSLFLSLFSGCGKADTAEPITKTGVYFDTVISITLYGTDMDDKFQGCFDLASKYENYFSNTLPDSDISKINTNIGTPVSVHDETIDLLQKGLAYGNLSNGSFDITIGELSDLWDFSNNTGTIPADTNISNALSTIDYHNVVINGNEVSLLAPSTTIDLGGIAKGYIADKMKAYLNEQGITSGIINLGGNVLTVGPKDNNDTYNIAIQKPFSEDGSPIASVEITDQSVVTSGTYQRYFKKDGIIYHHILDVTTGYPYENDLCSVTIINDSSVDGDGLSTTCFTYGLEKGMDYIESLDNTEAIFITNEEKIYYTSGIGTKIPFHDLSQK